MHYCFIQFVQCLIALYKYFRKSCSITTNLTLSGHNFILPAGHLEKARINVRKDVGCTFCRTEYSFQYLRQPVFRLVSDRFQHIIP